MRARVLIPVLASLALIGCGGTKTTTTKTIPLGKPLGTPSLGPTGDLEERVERLEQEVETLQKGP